MRLSSYREIKTHILAFLATSAMTLAGCSTNNCQLESSVYCCYYFYDSEGTPISYNDAITVSTHLPGTSRDTILINKLANSSMLKVPMSLYKGADTLFFKYSELYRGDTIIVEHDSYAHVDLPECGTRYFHHIKKVSLGNKTAAIDHIEISDPNVSYESKEHIKVYFNGTVQ